MKAQTTAFPTDQPWLTDKRWAGGLVRDQSGAALVFIWIFTIIWNAISVPVFILARRDAQAGKFIWVIALFPAFGFLILLAAIVGTLRRLKFGRSTFELETIPGAIGGWLGGIIRTSGSLDPQDGIHLTLSCINRVTTSSGESSSTSNNILWQDEQMLTRPAQRGPSGLEIPVAFQIPANCPATRPGNRDEIFWQLKASAALPGPNYLATFVVPVYAASPQAQPPPAEAIAAKLRRAPPTATERAALGKFAFSTDAAARRKFDFPAARNPGVAFFITFMAAFFIVAGLMARHFGAPLFFPIVFCIVGGLILFGAVVMWFMTRSAVVRSDGVEIRWRMLGFSGGRDVPAESISAVKYRSNMQSGDRAYFQVSLQTSGGNATVVGGLRLDDAKWIAQQIGEALGVASEAEVREFPSRNKSTART